MKRNSQINNNQLNNNQQRVSEEVFKKYLPTVRNIARKYANPLEEEDLYQEGCLVLYKLLLEAGDSEDFCYKLIACLRWRFTDILDHFYAEKRGFAKTFSGDSIISESEDGDILTFWDTIPCEDYFRKERDFAELTYEVRNKLSDTEKRILDVFVGEDEDFYSVVEEYKKRRNIDVLNKIPQKLVREYLNMSRREFERAFEHIQEVCTKVIFD